LVDSVEFIFVSSNL